MTPFNHLVTHDEIFAKSDSKVKQVKSEHLPQKSKGNLRGEKTHLLTQAPQIQIK